MNTRTMLPANYPPPRLHSISWLLTFFLPSNAVLSTAALYTISSIKYYSWPTTQKSDYPLDRR